jgi:hypothetical protein
MASENITATLAATVPHPLNGEQSVLPGGLFTGGAKAHVALHVSRNGRFAPRQKVS